MSSLTLKGATGALLGRARYAEPDEHHHISFLPQRRFVICDTVTITESQLRHWFSRFLECGPTQEDLDNGYVRPTNEQLRELGKKAPDVGFQLTGDVDSDAGFAISWDGGWIRGNASGCLLPVRFTPNHEKAILLRHEIESMLDSNSDTHHDVG